MTFGQQILATFIGSFFAFGFGIGLFYLTEKIKISKARGNLVKNLKREFSHNLSLLGDWLNDIDKVINQITASDNQIYVFLKLSAFQPFFLHSSFQYGVLYDLLDNEDIGELNKILSHCSLTSEHYFNDRINLWKDQ